MRVTVMEARQRRALAKQMGNCVEAVWVESLLCFYMMYFYTINLIFPVSR